MSIKPRLGFFDLTMIIVSMVIGVGIFKTPAIVAEKAGSPLLFFLAWAIGGIISLFGALTFAEIGSRMPVAGGFYHVFSKTYHPAFAFMLNWSQVVINAGSAVGVALVGAEYIHPIMPRLLQFDAKVTALLSISILFVFNFLGIKTGSRVQNILSMIKIGMILVFCFGIFMHSVPSVPGNDEAVNPTLNPLMALGIGLISVFYTYGGYQQTINFGADVALPEKNLPRSIITGITIVIALYLCLNLAYVNVLGFENLQGKGLIASELAGKLFGSAGFIVTSLAVYISVMGFLNTSFLSNPRVYFAMAEDKVLPPHFQKINTTTQVQEFGLTFYFALMLLSFFLFKSFEKILNYVMFIDSLGMIFAASTIFMLRRKMSRETYTGFKVPWFPLIPVIFICVLGAVCVNVFLSDYFAALMGVTIFLAGYPLFKLFRYFYRR